MLAKTCSALSCLSVTPEETAFQLSYARPVPLCVTRAPALLRPRGHTPCPSDKSQNVSNLQLKTPGPSTEQNNLSQLLRTFPRKSLNLRPDSDLKPPQWPDPIFQKRSLLS